MLGNLSFQRQFQLRDLLAQGSFRHFRQLTGGAVSRFAIAFSMDRPDAPTTSEATTPSFRFGSSSDFSIRLMTLDHSCAKVARIRVRSRNSRIARGGTKLPRSSPWCSRSAIRSPSLKSVFLPGIDFRCCGFTSRTSNPSNWFHTGFRYTPVASIATFVTFHSRSHAASSRNSAVVVPKRRFCFSALPSSFILIRQSPLPCAHRYDCTAGIPLPYASPFGGACRGRRLKMSESPLCVLRVATGRSPLFQNGARTKLARRLDGPIAVYGLDSQHAHSTDYSRSRPLSSALVSRRIIHNLVPMARSAPTFALPDHFPGSGVLSPES